MGNSSSKSPVNSKPTIPSTTSTTTNTDLIVSDCIDHTLGEISSSLLKIDDCDNNSDSLYDFGLDTSTTIIPEILPESNGTHSTEEKSEGKRLLIQSLQERKNKEDQKQPQERQPESSEKKCSLVKANSDSDSQQEATEDKENNAPRKSSASVYSLKQWLDFQEPSTSKQQHTTITRPKTQADIESQVFGPITHSIGIQLLTDDNLDQGEEYGNEDDFEFEYNQFEEDYYTTCLQFGIGSINDVMSNSKDSNENDSNQVVLCERKNDDQRNLKEFATLLTHLTGGDYGPRSQRKIYDDDSTTDSDSDGSYQAKKRLPIAPPPKVYELSNIEVPRTQKINKDGDPVEEKCNCHHHQKGGPKN